MIKFNKLPDIKIETNLLDYQGELVFLMNYLLEKGKATRVGAYNTDKSIPLFKHHEGGKFDVESITKKPGYKLLNDGIELQQVAKVNTLASWLISKFVIIQESAEKHYGEKLDRERNQPQIIAGAAHYLHQQENHKYPVQEKIIYGLSSFAFVLLAVYLYAKNTNTIFQVLSTSLLVTGIVSLISLLILKTSENLDSKLLRLGITTATFAFFLGIYQKIILSLDWDGRLAATFIIFPIILLLIFKALYLFTFALSRKSKEDSAIYRAYSGLERIKSNVFRLNEVTVLFTVASIGILIMANLSVFWSSLSYIVK